jgi:hypothetical protein
VEEADVDMEWVDSVLARHAEITEKELCPKCGGPWQEPAGVSLDYNFSRHEFTTKVVSIESYKAEQIENDTLDPWEVFLAEEVGDPSHFIVCAPCIAEEGGLPSTVPEPWYRDGSGTPR